MSHDRDDQIAELMIEGDRLVSIGDIDAALACYLQVLQEQGDSLEVYHKLIAAHDKMTREWTEKDFAQHMDWVLRQKELEDPTFKRIHARALPESREVQKLIKQLLEARSTSQETEIVEKIREFGDVAVYPLMDSILTFKTLLPRLKSILKPSTSDVEE